VVYITLSRAIFRHPINILNKFIANQLLLNRDKKKGGKAKFSPSQLQTVSELINNLKLSIRKAVALDLPDDNSTFSIYCDASKGGLGSVLLCHNENPDGTLRTRPVQLLSKSFNETERKYSTHKLEMLALLHSISRYRYYLQGRHFNVFTDNRALSLYSREKILLNDKVPAEWLLKLSYYNFTITHIPGVITLQLMF
jgi:hypothetical protein